MKNAIIGITGSLFYETKSSFLGNEYDYNNNNYSKCVVLAGGTPIYLPVINDDNIINEYLNLCDGILLPGGGDINPIFYNDSPRPLLGSFINKLDKFQIALAQKALSVNKPILGICRGIQVLNVAAGGTIYQDLSYANANHILHNHNNLLSEPCHSIKTTPYSIINDILGSKYVVNSGHHQSVKNIASGFTATAIAPDDIIEAIEMTSKEFVVGVQWHPEMMSLNDDKMLQLFKRFVQSSTNTIT